MIKVKGELKCPRCGYTYKKEEAPNEDTYITGFVPDSPEIVSAKRKKKYYDKQGNVINDPDLIGEIQRGANIISYHEEKPQ